MAKYDPQIAVDFFVHNGFTPAQAAGLVGNMMWETEGAGATSIDTTNGNPNGGPYGIVQWLGDRLTGPGGLYSYAQANNVSPSDLNIQLNFALHELNGSEKQAGDIIRQQQSPQDAAWATFNLYERAGDPSGPNRAQYAQTVFNHYHGDSASRSTSAGGANLVGAASAGGAHAQSATDQPHIKPSSDFSHNNPNAHLSSAAVSEGMADVAASPGHNPQSVYSSPGSEPKNLREIQSGKSIYHGGAPITDVDYSTNAKGQLVTQTHTASGAIVGEVYDPNAKTNQLHHPYTIKGPDKSHTPAAAGADLIPNQTFAHNNFTAGESTGQIQQAAKDLSGLTGKGTAGHNPQSVYPMGPVATSGPSTNSSPSPVPPILPDPGPPPPTNAHGNQAVW